MSMTNRLIGLVAIAASTGLIAAAVPAAAGQSASEGSPPAAAVSAGVVNGDCQGGGRVTLRVQASGDTYVLTASASNLPVDGRWRGGFAEQSSNDDDYVDRDFAVRAVDGAWSITRTLPALELPAFNVVTFGPGPIDIEQGRLCVLLIQPAKPFAGITYCHTSYQLGLTAVLRPSGRLVVRYAAYNAKPGTHWTVTVAAVDGDSGSASSTSAVAGPRGGFRGKLAFGGQTNPRLKLTVVSDRGQNCTVRIRRTFAPTAAPRLDGSVSSAGAVRALRNLVAEQRSRFDQR